LKFVVAITHCVQVPNGLVHFLCFGVFEKRLGTLRKDEMKILGQNPFFVPVDLIAEGHEEPHLKRSRIIRSDQMGCQYKLYVAL